MSPPTAVHRVEVRPRPGLDDPRGASVARQAGAMGVPLASARAARVYLIQADINEDALRQVMSRLLADPVTETATQGASPGDGAQVVEVHPLPGVMDPAAQSVRDAIQDLIGDAAGVQITTGWRYDLAGADAPAAERIARRLLANPAVHRIHMGPFHPAELPRGHQYTFSARHIPIRELDDGALERLSREAHLFLSLEEMRAIQAEYKRRGREPSDIELETLAQTWSEHCVHKTLKSKILYRGNVQSQQAPATPAAPARQPGGRRMPEASFTFTPTGKSADLSGRPIGSEHRGTPGPEPQRRDPIVWKGRPGHTLNPDGSVTIDNLLKSTVAAATHELIADGVDWTLSVFKDNAGVISFDEKTAVCIKVETHNHPSAIEPYGGAATGIGGCIRDVIGTGLAAKPIASTDVFCVAMPAGWREDGEGSSEARPLPPGCLHPRRILRDVVAGVRDYGNRMGIPTVSGAVAFDDRYVGNPLVFCGCVGVMPRDRIEGRARAGDRVIALGGRTGRDGIHGATFSSAELEETHADEFAHAVQIGNAIEEKRVLDAILRARDAEDGPLFHAITDCGAGGFSSAVGEMGRELGAEINLEQAPLKYDGLSYTEIWISEAQERMVLAVAPANLPALRRICDEEHVELADLGQFGTTDRALVLRFHGQEVGRLDMEFLHDGLPQPTRQATWAQPASPRASLPAKAAPSVGDTLLALLSHPDIASKHWIIRQYDHEVQGNLVLKPLVGPGGRGPGDASIVEPVPGSGRGLAISCGLATGIGDPAAGGDPYIMVLAAIDECVRNLVCVGADPRRIAILDNFCWPSCAKPENLGSLVRAAEGCYDGAKAYRTPFVSGKDSLNNQLKYDDPATGEPRVIEIPPTLLITGMGVVPSTARAVTMDAKSAENLLILIGETTGALGGSHLERLFGLGSFADDEDAPRVPPVDLAGGPRAAQAVAELIRQELVVSAHDCSDGGMLVAVAEMLIATSSGAQARELSDLLSRPSAPAPLGAELSVDPGVLHPLQSAFAETPSRYVLEIRPGDYARIRTILRDHDGVRAETLGRVTRSGRLVWAQADLDMKVLDLAEAWLRPLDY